MSDGARDEGQAVEGRLWSDNRIGNGDRETHKIFLNRNEVVFIVVTVPGVGLRVNYNQHLK